MNALGARIERRRRSDRRTTGYIFIRLAGISGGAGDTGPVLRRDFVRDPLDPSVGTGAAEHQDRAGRLPSTDRDVRGAWRRVQVVPLSHEPLLAFHHSDAL